MKVLVLCDQGNNRSVTIASHLKYWHHDVIPAGIDTNSPDTLRMLVKWADRVIVTDRYQIIPWDGAERDKLQLWDIGPDIYPRPFNHSLMLRVRELMEQHKAEYKHVTH